LTQSAPRSHGLDTLRSLAIISVIVFHLHGFHGLGRTAPILDIAAQMGWMGVDLFFVLSGFLIGQQVLKPYLLGQRFYLVEFYRRRIYRILPAYLVVLALYFLVPGWRESPRLPALWKFLTFTMNFGISFDRHGFSHAWSLCVEEHFYLLLPLMVILLMRHPSARKTIDLSDAEMAALSKALGRRADARSYAYLEVLNEKGVLGYVFILNVIGESQPITFAIGVTADGALQDVQVMVYREPQGEAIQEKRFRKQFVGKRSKDPITLDKDIDAISGATISSRSATFAARKGLLLAEVLRGRASAGGKP